MTCVKLTLENNVKRAVEDVLRAHILRENDVIPDHLNMVMERICRDVFGNIAIYQASEVTIFPDVLRNMPPIVGVLAPIAIAEGANAAPRAVNRDLNLRYNIRETVNTLKAMPQTSNVECVRGATFRQLCVPFAEAAKSFLREVYNVNGKVTALAETLPAICSSAPWVAFDFNRGLNFRSLTQDEKRVIQNLNRRLFATQGKLNVINAQVDGNLSEMSA